MKIFRIIAQWLRSNFSTLLNFKYRTEHLNDFPATIKPKRLYIVTEGCKAETLIFKCPCGCEEDIYLNLLQDTRPCWTYSINTDESISVAPSIWRKVNCKSHFFIKRSKVIWA